MTPPTVLIAISSLSTVLDLMYGLSVSLALILAKVCLDSLLAGGMACREIKQFPHHPWLVASQLIDKGLIIVPEMSSLNHILVLVCRP